MEIVIANLTVPNLHSAGASHPILGPFLNGGSYCAVEGTDVAEILSAARQAAGEEGMPLLVVGGRPAPSDLLRTAQRAALCLLVSNGGSPPLAVFYGRGLPALGSIPPCKLRDLQTTWAALTGGAPREGRHLLQEQPEAWDPQLERQLTQRLRQLYGE
jgi:hypothetical protein